MCGVFSLFSWSDTQVEAALSAFASVCQCLQNDSGGVGDKRVTRDCLFRVYVCAYALTCVCADARMYVSKPSRYCQFLRQDHYPGTHQVG